MDKCTTGIDIKKRGVSFGHDVSAVGICARGLKLNRRQLLGEVNTGAQKTRFMT
jgi:hypothetical protein